MVRPFGKSSLKFVFLAAISLLVSAESRATHCYGTIKALYVDASSNVLILPSFRNDWVQICNSQSAWSGIDPGTCKIWIGLATTLRVTQEQAVVYYSSASLACDTIPSYGEAPAPGYIMYYLP
jgi:hypothetical protein